MCMSKVFSECTCCLKPLNEEDMKMNEEEENYYYTICSECLDKFTNKIVKIAEKK